MCWSVRPSVPVSVPALAFEKALLQCAVADCVDPKDNQFLALAETAGADLIVASAPHLTSMHPWRGIAILPPRAFLVAIL